MKLSEIDPSVYDGIYVDVYVDEVHHQEDDLASSEDANGNVLKVCYLDVGVLVGRLQEAKRAMLALGSGCKRVESHLPAGAVCAADGGGSHCGDFILSSHLASFSVWEDCEIMDIDDLEENKENAWLSCTVPGRYNRNNDLEFDLNIYDILKAADAKLESRNNNMDIHTLDPAGYDVYVDLLIPDMFAASSELDFDRDDDENVLKVKQLHVGTFLQRVQHGVKLLADPANSDIQRLKYHLPALVVAAASGTCECGDYTLDIDDASFYVGSSTDCAGDDPQIWCIVPGVNHVLEDMEFTIDLDEVIQAAKKQLKHTEK